MEWELGKRDEAGQAYLAHGWIEGNSGSLTIGAA